MTGRLLPLALGLLAVVALAAPGDRSSGTREFVGTVEPANATKMLASPNFFNLGGWNSSSGRTKVSRLVEDGATVAAGEVVAEFEFRAADALQWLDRALREAEARQARDRLENERDLIDLAVQLRKAKLLAEQARLETLKRRSVSERQARLTELSYQEALFEVDALEQIIAAKAAAARVLNELRQREVDNRRHRRGLYDRFEARFKLVAPHAGVVRHAFNDHSRRKMQQGDNVRAGSEVLSIAADQTLEARFYVPEAAIALVQVGDPVAVVALDGTKAHQGEVREIEGFPNEMGFLRDNEELPNAREKAHVVIASLTGETGDLGAGNEVVVRWEPTR